MKTQPTNKTSLISSIEKELVNYYSTLLYIKHKKFDKTLQSELISPIKRAIQERRVYLRNLIRS